MSLRQAKDLKRMPKIEPTLCLFKLAYVLVYAQCCVKSSFTACVMTYTQTAQLRLLERRLVGMQQRNVVTIEGASSALRPLRA